MQVETRAVNCSCQSPSTVVVLMEDQLGQFLIQTTSNISGTYQTSIYIQVGQVARLEIERPTRWALKGCAANPSDQNGQQLTTLVDNMHSTQKHFAL